MRHRVAGKRLGRSSAHRKALRRNLVIALFQNERIRTTRAKAEAIRGQAEKLITRAKRALDVEEADPAAGVHARRIAASRSRLLSSSVSATGVDELSGSGSTAWSCAASAVPSSCGSVSSGSGVSV